MNLLLTGTRDPGSLCSRCGGLRAGLVAATLLALALAFTAPVPARAEEPEAASVPEASAVVERLNATLLEVMQGATELGYPGREARLAPVVRDTYDMHTIARLALGGQWRKLDKDSQAQFVELLERMIVANYAGRFSSYSGESFEVLGEDEAPSASRLVRTRIVRVDAEPVRLDYRLQRRSDGWRIVDVFLGSTVSELALRRAEYSAVIRRDGYQELVRELKERIAALERGEP